MLEIKGRDESVGACCFGWVTKQGIGFSFPWELIKCAMSIYPMSLAEKACSFFWKCKIWINPLFVDKKSKLNPLTTCMA